MIRCIEGHVFDADEKNVCPVCGWEPPKKVGKTKSSNGGKAGGGFQVSDIGTIMDRVVKATGLPLKPGIPARVVFMGAVVFLIGGVFAVIHSSAPQPGGLQTITPRTTETKKAAPNTGSQVSAGRGYLGVQIQARADGAGVVVAQTPQADTPAAKAGILKGDMILALNGETLTDPNDLTSRVGSIAPGKKVKLKIIRDGAERMIDVTLAKLPDDLANAPTPHGSTAPETSPLPPGSPFEKFFDDFFNNRTQQAMRDEEYKVTGTDQEGYGALAFSPSTQEYGEAYGYNTRNLTERKAIEVCSHNDCALVVSVFHQCASLIVGSNGKWSAGIGTVAAEAVNQGKLACTNNKGTDCKVWAVICPR